MLRLLPQKPLHDLRHAVDKFPRRFPDRIHRGAQFLHLPVAAPPGDIGEGIIGRIQPEILADGVRYALCLHFPCHFILLVPKFLHDVPVMQLRMGHFVDSGFHRLHFAHAVPDDDLLVRIAVKAFRFPLNPIKSYGNRGNLPDRLHENLIILHVPH